MRAVSPIVAGLLGLMVLLQSTDLVRCADEVGRPTELQHLGGTPGDGSGSEAAHGADAAAGGHSNAPHEGGIPDCLCHVVFVSTAMLPTLPPPSDPSFVYPVLVGTPVEGDPSPPGHVPLA